MATFSVQKETSGLLREGLLHYLLLYLHYFCIGAIPTNVTLSRNVLLIWHFPHLYCGIFRFTGSWWISIWKENLNSVLINNLININKTNNHFWPQICWTFVIFWHHTCKLACSNLLYATFLVYSQSIFPHVYHIIRVNFTSLRKKPTF
jgi:hypothetical protein